MNYSEHYIALITKYGRAFKPEGYSERHHIIPRCLGGGEEESNLIYLSAEAHYVAHQLLVKIHPGHYGVSYAAMLMTRIGNGKGNGRASNKYYAWLKKRFSELNAVRVSAHMKGNTHLLGHTHSEESKLRMSAASLGKSKSEKHKQNIARALLGRAPRTGWKHSDETKKKIAESLKGRVFSEETKAKMRKPKCRKL